MSRLKKIYKDRPNPKWALQQRRLYLADKLSKKRKRFLEALPLWAEFVAKRPKTGLKIFVCQKNPRYDAILQQRSRKEDLYSITFALTDTQAQELLNEASQKPPTEAWIKSHPGYVYGYYENDLGIIIWDKIVCWAFHSDQKKFVLWRPTHSGAEYKDFVVQRPLTFEPHPAWSEHIPESCDNAYLAFCKHHAEVEDALVAAEEAAFRKSHPPIKPKI